MGRKHIIKPYLVMDETALAVSMGTLGTNVEQVDHARYTIAWANGDGAQDFEIKIQSTTDAENIPDSAANWFDLSLGFTSPTILPANVAGSHVIDLELIVGRRLRLYFTRNAGAADIQVIFNANTKGA